MEKIIALAAITLTAMAFAAPAQADTLGNVGQAVNDVTHWNFSAAAVCLQEVAVVPVLGDWAGDHTSNCSNGNVIDHSGS